MDGVLVASEHAMTRFETVQDITKRKESARVNPLECKTWGRKLTSAAATPSALSVASSSPVQQGALLCLLPLHLFDNKHL